MTASHGRHPRLFHALPTPVGLHFLSQIQFRLLSAQCLDLALHGRQFLTQLFFLRGQGARLLAGLFLTGGDLLRLLIAQGLIGAQHGELLIADRQ